MLWLTLLLLAFFSITLYGLAPILTPFITSIVLAYLLDPMVKKGETLGLSRTTASAVPVAVFFTALFGLMLVAIPLIAEDAQRFASKIPESIAWVEQKLTEEHNPLTKLQEFGIHLTVADVQARLSEYTGHISKAALNAAKSTASGALAIVDIVSFMVLTPLVMFYILADWPKFTSTTTNLIPQSMKNQILNLLKQIDNKMSALIRGQLMVALSLGLFYGITLSLSGLQMGFFLGLLTGMLSIIPFVGFLLGLIASAIVAVLQYQFSAAEPYLILAAIFAAGQVLESFYLTPKLLGNKVGLHPVWVIFALMAGGHLLGLLGMLIALPIAIVVQVILPFILKKWAKKVDDETPKLGNEKGTGK